MAPAFLMKFRPNLQICQSRTARKARFDSHPVNRSRAGIRDSLQRRRYAIERKIVTVNERALSRSPITLNL
jgi:hypothetical protein